MTPRRMCLKLRRRRFALRLICAAFVIVVVVGFVVVDHILDEDRCDNEELQDMLSSVCKSYKDRVVTGSLCRPLCDDSEVHYIKCLNYRRGKKIIFATWNEKTVILKAKHLRPEERELLGYVSNSLSTYMPTIVSFMSMVRNSIAQEFDVTDSRTDEDLLYLLWTGSETVSEILLKNNLGKDQLEQQRRVMRSLWSLLQQNEYIFLQYYSDNPHLPKIYGSCGHVYAMEYAPSTGVLDPDILQISGMYTFSWHERVKIAIDLLNIIKSTEDDFGEVLYFCDVKGSNFGIGQDGKVKPIDTDTVFLRSKLESTIYHTDFCNQSSDCDFFDCLGKCDISKHTCDRKVQNNNLESVCRKIFTKGMENMYTGLLSNPPTKFKSRLNIILESCLQLNGDNLHNSEKVFDQLYSLLQESNRYS